MPQDLLDHLVSRAYPPTQGLAARTEATTQKAPERESPGRREDRDQARSTADFRHGRRAVPRRHDGKPAGRCRSGLRFPPPAGTLESLSLLHSVRACIRVCPLGHPAGLSLGPPERQLMMAEGSTRVRMRAQGPAL